MKNKYDEKYDYRNQAEIKKHFTDFLQAFPYTPERNAYLQRYGQSYDNVYTTMMIFNYMKGKDMTLTWTSCRSWDATPSSINW